ncbi:YTH-domain-containing protein [Gonapodya prolifera JEL478]|uniref:YTH-domain-containing protein n=1 Tax=Gonapodya prolifera (strain JEL478) TaxID=1344416 RepID=A0A139AZG3_GONPJ|nr:YTH-domain-containing protein [Gonapodya prolifera JEL478]|eukprot:KXS22107.1 YTH-domain-containing protein [Gonapodya prolifera JEL478]
MSVTEVKDRNRFRVEAQDASSRSFAQPPMSAHMSYAAEGLPAVRSVDIHSDGPVGSVHHGRGTKRLREADARATYENNDNSEPTLNNRRNDVVLTGSRTKYFVLRSNNYDNLDISREKNVWATLNRNAAVLGRAFEQSRKVVLFFSVNESRHFQGYAEMTTNIGGAIDIETPWARMSNLCPNFGVRWLKIEELNFDVVSQLKNPLNENKPIRSSRDGQELTEEIAGILIDAFEKQGVPPGTSRRLHHPTEQRERRPTRPEFHDRRNMRSPRSHGRMDGSSGSRSYPRESFRDSGRYPPQYAGWDRTMQEYYPVDPYPSGSPYGFTGYGAPYPPYPAYPSRYS